MYTTVVGDILVLYLKNIVRLVSLQTLTKKMLVQVGLDVPDLYTMDQPEDGANNARRMQRLWDLEVARHKKL